MHMAHNAFAFIGHATLKISHYYYRISTLFTLGCNIAFTDDQPLN